MEESDVSYSLDSQQQFWDELEYICSTRCQSNYLIDNTLRSYLHFTTKFKEDYLSNSDDVARCAEKLVGSELYVANQDYVRTQIVYSLLQEDDPTSLFIIAYVLMVDGRQDEGAFEVMKQEGCFERLLGLVRSCSKQNAPFLRLLLDLLYEMSRVQRLDASDLNCINNDFVSYLFQIVEEFSEDVDDPYHYPVIRVLLVLNEQYMVLLTGTSGTDIGARSCPANRVIRTLSLYGAQYRTFGENLILLLNRETETALQLLILKLLYLLFTTKATYEYFYTNDLRVLLDVILRNLLDLPDELISLRHTYLRVLYPLLSHTQLAQPPHYKSDEVSKTLKLLSRSGNFHFAPTDETTLRLVQRVTQVAWLHGNNATGYDHKRNMLGVSLSQSQASSSISVLDVAAVSERPGIQTPSRSVGLQERATAVARQEDETPAGDEAFVVVKFSHPQDGAIDLPLEVSDRILLDDSKRMPPRAPPRRRTKVKATAAGNSNGASQEHSSC